MEENNDKKVCPFCGAKINKEAKKCRFCGNWIDEEILCPFCAEKIKASAKKCHFCGEWLNKDEEINEKENIQKSENYHKKNFFNGFKNNIWIIIGILLIILLIVSITVYAIYIPSCKSYYIQSKLEEYLISNYPEINNLIIHKDSAYKLKRIEKGYSCSINANIEEIPTQIEYSYKKVAFNEFDINAQFVLPNCYDSSVKILLNNLIKKSDLYNIKNNTDDIITKYEKQDNYDKEAKTYTCSAEAVLTSKPGKAYLLQPWDYDIATRKIKCKADYKSYFCENGYTTCVSLNDLYACEYEED